MAKKPAAPAADQPAEQEVPAKAKAPAFIFLGDSTGHGPDEIDAFGYTFAKNGKPVTVDKPAAAKKLAANSHFKAV